MAAPVNLGTDKANGGPKSSSEPGNIDASISVVSDARRLSRNESEKARRDRLNSHIQELARLVPLVAGARRKLDKSSILRLTVNYLRLHHEVTKKMKKNMAWRPKFLNHENLGQTFLESLKGFLLVISRKGILVYASEEISKLLGHSQIDIMGQSVYNIIHPQDHEILKRQFSDDEDLTDTCNMPYKNGYTDLHVPSGCHRSFFIRIASSSQDRKSTSYQKFQVVGHLRQISITKQELNGSGGSGSPLVSCLMCIAMPVECQMLQELHPTDAGKNCWVTQHAMDARLLYIDQRACPITGFMSHEQTGRFPYEFLVPSDIRWVAGAHQLIVHEGIIPRTIFRMYTRCNEPLYVASLSQVVIDQWTGKPKYITTVNELLNPEEGKELLRIQQEKVKAFLAKQELQIQECEEEEESESSGLDTDEDYQCVCARANNERLIINLGVNKSFEVKLITEGEKSDSCPPALSSGAITEAGEGKQLQQVPPVKRKAENSSPLSSPKHKTCYTLPHAKPSSSILLSQLKGTATNLTEEVPQLGSQGHPSPTSMETTTTVTCTGSKLSSGNMLATWVSTASRVSLTDKVSTFSFSPTDSDNSNRVGVLSEKKVGLKKRRLSGSPATSPVQDTTVNSSMLSLGEETSALCNGQSEKPTGTDNEQLTATHQQLNQRLKQQAGQLEMLYSMYNQQDRLRQQTEEEAQQAQQLKQKLQQLQRLQTTHQQQESLLYQLCQVYKDKFRDKLQSQLQHVETQLPAPSSTLSMASESTSSLALEHKESVVSQCDGVTAEQLCDTVTVLSPSSNQYQQQLLPSDVDLTDGYEQDLVSGTISDLHCLNFSSNSGLSGEDNGHQDSSFYECGYPEDDVQSSLMALNDLKMDTSLGDLNRVLVSHLLNSVTDDFPTIPENIYKRPSCSSEDFTNCNNNR